MGNSNSSTTKTLEIEDNPLNKEERAAIESYYQKFLHDGVPSKEKFCEEFYSNYFPNFGESCYRYILGQSSDHLTLPLFMKFVINGARSTSTKTLQLVWDIITIDETIPPEQYLDYFFLLLLELSGCDPTGIQTTAARLSRHVMYINSKDSSSGEVMINSRILINWTNEFAPHTHKVFVSFLNDKCFSTIELIGYTPFRSPQLEGGSSVLNQSDIVPLALYDITLQGRWKKLYTTQADGLSFNRIAHHILGYSGPSLILIRCAGIGVCIGAYNEDRWRDSNRFYGNSSAFLCTLSPDLRIYRSRSDSNNAYQWLNLKSYGMPHGIGMGGTLEKFRLFIPDTLEDCVAHSNCLTFEGGSLLYPSSSSAPSQPSYDPSTTTNSGAFVIDVLEIWGCGGDEVVNEALSAQKKDRGERDELVRKARLVDKAAFANNMFDQEFLLPKNFSHKVRMADASACEDEKETRKSPH